MKEKSDFGRISDFDGLILKVYYNILGGLLCKYHNDGAILAGSSGHNKSRQKQSVECFNI
jgi:hypothetical protein